MHVSEAKTPDAAATSCRAFLGNRLTRTVVVSLGLIGVLVLAFLVRVRFLYEESAWYDEIITIQHLDSPSLGDYMRATAVLNAANQPLHFVIMYYWSVLFGGGEPAARLLSILFGLGSVALVYLIAKRMAGDESGLLAALLMATNHWSIRFSLEIRMYALTVFLALLSLYTFLKVLTTNGRWWWALHIATTVALVWTHAFAALMLAAEGLMFLMFGPKNLRVQLRWFVLQLLACLTLVVWLARAHFSAIDEQMGWVSLPSLKTFLTSLWRWGVTRVFGVPYSRYVGDVFMCFFVASLIGVVARAVTDRTMRRRARPEGDQATVVSSPAFAASLCVSWLLLPAVMLFAISYVWRPSYVPRYLLASSASLFLLIGFQYSLLRRRAPKAVFLGVVVLLAIAQGCLAALKPYRAPWHAVREVLRQEYHGAPLAVHVVSGSKNESHLASVELRYHLKGIRHTPTFGEDIDGVMAKLESWRSQDRNLFVVFRATPGKAKRFEERLVQLDWPYQKWHFDAMAPMTVFKLGAAMRAS